MVEGREMLSLEEGDVIYPEDGRSGGGRSRRVGSCKAPIDRGRHRSFNGDSARLKETLAKRRGSSQCKRFIIVMEALVDEESFEVDLRLVI
jgi:hypothetical protein